MVQDTIDRSMEDNVQTSPDRSGGDTTMAAVSHILALFSWFLGPLILYVVSDDPFVKRNSANAFNWQISFTLWLIVSGLLTVVLVGFIGLLVLPLLDLVFCILGAVKATEGEAWNYPLTIDLL